MAQDTPTASIDPDHLTSPGAVMGTIAYMSPEQARGEALDARTDLFSFGSVLYEAATGRHAFDGPTSAVIAHQILAETPVPPLALNLNLPAKLGEIIGRLLEKDRELRYQSAADLRSELKRLKRDTDSGRVAPASGRTIGVGGIEWSRFPLPPNRTGGFPASGSPVGGLTYKRIDVPAHEP